MIFKTLGDIFDLNNYPELRFKAQTRELFISRNEEKHLITDFHGKCSVIHYQESNDAKIILESPDTFFYSLIYDTTTKKLKNVRSFMRIGDQYQANIIPTISSSTSNEIIRESLVWSPTKETGIFEKYFIEILCLAILARRLRDGSHDSPDLLTASASAGIRDITLEKAHQILHLNDYNVDDSVFAFSKLIHSNEIFDDFEKWTITEGEIFEEALVKYSKNFSAINMFALPERSVKELISFYYSWKTINSYVEHQTLKRKATQQEEVSLTEAIHTLPDISQANNHRLDDDDSCLICAKKMRLRRVNDCLIVCCECHHFWMRYGQFPTTLGLILTRQPKSKAPPSYSAERNFHDPVDEFVLKVVLFGDNDEDEKMADSPRILSSTAGIKKDWRNFMFHARKPMKFARQYVMHGEMRRLSRRPLCTRHSLSHDLTVWKDYYKENLDDYKRNLSTTDNRELSIPFLTSILQVKNVRKFHKKPIIIVPKKSPRKTSDRTRIKRIHGAAA